jgi:hypothetical protein
LPTPATQPRPSPPRATPTAAAGPARRTQPSPAHRAPATTDPEPPPIEQQAARSQRRSQRSRLSSSDRQIRLLAGNRRSPRVGPPHSCARAARSTIRAPSSSGPQSATRSLSLQTRSIAGRLSDLCTITCSTRCPSGLTSSTTAGYVGPYARRRGTCLPPRAARPRPDDDRTGHLGNPASSDSSSWSFTAEPTVWGCLASQTQELQQAAAGVVLHAEPPPAVVAPPPITLTWRGGCAHLGTWWGRCSSVGAPNLSVSAR